MMETLERVGLADAFQPLLPLFPGPEGGIPEGWVAHHYVKV